MIDWTVAIISSGRTIGSTIVHVVRHTDAPSSDAASSTSSGTPLIPAYIVTSTNGNEHQITSAATSPNAPSVPKVHEWCSNGSPSPDNTSLTRPKSVSKRNSQT